MALGREGRASTSSALSWREAAVPLDMVRLEGLAAGRCGLPCVPARCGAERMDIRALGPWNLVGSGAEAGAEPGVGE